jgi:uncharacterized protein (TIGR02246 family)
MSLQDQIKATFDRMNAAWKTNDGSAVAGFFTEDASLINPFGERADGRAAIAALYTQYFGGMLRGTTSSFELSSVRAVENNHCFVDGEQTIKGADGNVALVVHLTSLLRREGTDWRISDGRPYAYAKPPA